jgi:hypothetical protein
MCGYEMQVGWNVFFVMSTFIQVHIDWNNFQLKKIKDETLNYAIQTCENI